MRASIKRAGKKELERNGQDDQDSQEKLEYMLDSDIKIEMDDVHTETVRITFFPIFFLSLPLAASPISVCSVCNLQQPPLRRREELFKWKFLLLSQAAKYP